MLKIRRYAWVCEDEGIKRSSTIVPAKIRSMLLRISGERDRPFRDRDRDFGNVTEHFGNVTERTGRQDWRCA